MAEDTSMAALIANSAKTDPRMWEAIGNIPKAYYEGQNQRYQQDLRNAFKDDNGNFRQDLLDDKGNPDSGKMYQRLITIGGAPAVEAASKLAETGFQQDRYRNAPTVSGILQGNMPQQAQPPQGQPAPQGQPGQASAPQPPMPTDNLPPSASRGASAVVRPPLARGGLVPASAPGPSAGAPASPQGDQPGSVVGLVSAAGVPDNLAGKVIGNIASSIGIDPNASLNPQQTARVQQALQAAAQRGAFKSQPTQAPPQAQPVAAGAGGLTPQNAVTPAGAAPAPLATAAANFRQASRQQPPQARPDNLNGLVPPGYDPATYADMLDAVAGSGRILPDQAAVIKGKVEAIRKALEPTPDMKNARAAGMSVKDYLDRNDNASTERAILTNSILPKLDKSQDTAIAARDDIKAINQGREELDRPGGIFSGAAADVRLKVAKVAEFLGVPNADKISNTEAFNVPMGQRTLALVKGLGAGTGISNADRDFAAQMAGGNIKLDEKSIRRILDISEKAARAKIDLHNGLADRTLKANDSLSSYGPVYRVDQPEQYQRASQAMPVPKVGAVIGGHKYLGGNPNEQRSWGRI